ncbi:hypothetical protein KW823_26140, partial [Enterobacter quasiroggenkampii]|nr:hypothetical protein [Enterobacter quasiroggenkampii]
LVPFYFLLVNSVKSFGDLLSNAASWPESFEWANYQKAWEMTKFPQAFTNSLLITVVSVLLVGLTSAMAAYRMVRHNTRFNRTLFMLFVAAMVIPFQSIMIPLVKVTGTLKLTDSMLGLVVCYLG